MRKWICAIFGLGVLSSFAALADGIMVLQKNDKVVFFGDSITRFGAMPGGYVSLVSEAIAQACPEKGVEVTGAGVGGNKVPDLLVRVDRDVLSHKPSVVMIYIGINDIWHWTKPHPVTKEAREGTTAENYEAGLRSLIAQIQASNARVILCTPTVIGEQVNPDNSDFQRLEDYSAICRTVARETGATLLDLRKVFIEHLTAHNPDGQSRGVLTKDGVHMNDAGNRLIAQQVCNLFQVPLATVKMNGSTKQKSMELYLLIGQSNMAGRAPIPADAKGDIENCFLLNDQGEWAPASNPLNRYSSVRKDLRMQKLGPGYSFAKTMLAQSPDRSLGLVVNALGGSKIEFWEKGGRLYEEAVARMKVAQQSGTLKGILWHQGESNHTDADYLPKLVQLIADLRADLNDKNLPVVVGQINNIPLINDQLAKLPKQVPYTACVSSEGLTAQDKWHFNAASQLKLGERYAEAISALLIDAKQGKNKAETKKNLPTIPEKCANWKGRGVSSHLNRG